MPEDRSGFLDALTCKKVPPGFRVESQTGSVCFWSRLQNAAADRLRHREQLVLPKEAELHLMPIRKADSQLRGLERVAKSCGLDAIMQHLAVRQNKDLLPGPGHALHIHHDDAARSKDHLIAHRFIRAYDHLIPQQQCLHILADLLLLDADEVLHRLFSKFHLQRSLHFDPVSIVARQHRLDKYSPFRPECAILVTKFYFGK